MSNRALVIVGLVAIALFNSAIYLGGYFPSRNAPETPIPQNAVPISPELKRIFQQEFLPARERIKRKEAILGLRKDRDELFGIVTRMNQIMPKDAGFDERGFIIPRPVATPPAPASK